MSKIHYLKVKYRFCYAGIFYKNLSTESRVLNTLIGVEQ
ncbi:hypothetical protein ECHHL_0441 [Ehrlichia chaffeensis str. Heartland]|nr:hypothetical protein ECHHL_0441 [Ehrlichia chaffeensis str. Heartland]AHX05676.1 hypothetical protein ECHJAX_0615 [Ehrlichia chaffeensis str. Jax]AHX06667.1 hypothetical protein ECHLIB_0617 [Ehrlichia chaffeensis str. Liberty]AHX07360.1 hypothetical protein ECHOSC_0449 [Ehrlichia chaffeensis str. Osceola]AHX08191.1 hypothetical protein ECHSTV_0605 [Ehrlichia chaffeensis str. Saint Vincent]AHX09849.1 hypothetical protein ECHWAK_0610 [Ehrlichia chaffeensis str. Wakulla]AHX10311.1 hypothetica